MNLLQKVAQVSRATRRFDGDYYGTFLDVLNNVELPKPKTEDGEEDDEDLDFENFGFSNVEDDEITFSAGGDWQEPLVITIKYDEKKDKIYVASYSEGYEDDYTIKFNEIMKKVVVPVEEVTVRAEDVVDVPKRGTTTVTADRKQLMRDQANQVFELTKGLTPEERKKNANYLLTIETMAGYILELTNDL